MPTDLPTPDQALQLLTPADVRAWIADHGDRGDALARNRYLMLLLKVDPPPSQAEAYLITLKAAARDVAASLQAFVLADMHGRHHERTRP